MWRVFPFVSGPAHSTLQGQNNQAQAKITRPGHIPFSLKMGQARQQTRSTITAVAGGDPAASVTGGNTAAVCVIGAGAAGLAAGRLLRDEGLHVTILEKSLHVGGVWRYNAGSGEKAPMCKSVYRAVPVNREGGLRILPSLHLDLQNFQKISWSCLLNERRVKLAKAAVSPHH